jgi:hypothetical protein
MSMIGNATLVALRKAVNADLIIRDGAKNHLMCCYSQS